MEAPGIDHDCTEALRSAVVAMTKRREVVAMRPPNRVEAPGIEPRKGQFGVLQRLRELGRICVEIPGLGWGHRGDPIGLGWTRLGNLGGNGRGNACRGRARRRKAEGRAS